MHLNNLPSQSEERTQHQQFSRNNLKIHSPQKVCEIDKQIVRFFSCGLGTMKCLGIVRYAGI